MDQAVSCGEVSTAAAYEDGLPLAPAALLVPTLLVELEPAPLPALTNDKEPFMLLMVWCGLLTNNDDAAPS